MKQKTGLQVMRTGTAVILGIGTAALLYTAGTLAFGSDIFPWLGAVAERLLRDLGSPGTWTDLGLTLTRTFTGFLLAFVFGVPLGLQLGRSTWSDRVFFLPIILLQACPPLFWVIPMILILGTDGQAPVAVVFLVVLPLVILSVRDARKSLTPTLRDVFRVYAPSRLLIARELLLPALGSALRSSLVVGLILGLKSAVLGEWFGSHTGLGRAIFRLYEIFDMPGFFALVFLFLTVGAILGLASESLAQSFLPSRRPSKPSDRPTFFRLLQKTIGQRSKRSDRLNPTDLAPAHLSLFQVDFRWDSRPLLGKIDLDISPGEVVVLTGPSGSGKTTLARLALGLIKPIRGKVVSPVRPAVLFQEDGLLGHRDVLGNTLLPAWQQRLPDAEVQARALISRVGLEGEEQKFPEELSGGMKKRAALARALMQRPDFLVFDEPFQNLDERSRNELWNLTFELLADRGLGALVITHYPHELDGRAVRFWPLPIVSR